MKLYIIFFLLAFPMLALAQADSLAAVLLYDDFPSDTALICVEEEAKPINMSDLKRQIGYPAAFRDGSFCFTFIYRVLVNSRGEYVAHKRLKSCGNDAFSQQIESRLPQLRFTPAIQDGRPVAMWINMRFQFCVME